MCGAAASPRPRSSVFSEYCVWRSCLSQAKRSSAEYAPSAFVSGWSCCGGRACAYVSANRRSPKPRCRFVVPCPRPRRFKHSSTAASSSPPSPLVDVIVSNPIQLLALKALSYLVARRAHCWSGGGVCGDGKALMSQSGELLVSLLSEQDIHEGILLG